MVDETLVQGKFTIEQAMSDPEWLKWFNAFNNQRDRVETMEQLLENEKWILGNIGSAEPFIHPQKKHHFLMKTRPTSFAADTRHSAEDAQNSNQSGQA
jgi:hypothetical protein